MEERIKRIKELLHEPQILEAISKLYSEKYPEPHLKFEAVKGEISDALDYIIAPQ